MAQMSPDMYCGVLRKAKELIFKAEECLIGRTADGLIEPIISQKALEEMILECENTKANLSVAIKCLQKNSTKKSAYQSALEEIYSAQEKLQHCKDELFK